MSWCSDKWWSSLELQCVTHETECNFFCKKCHVQICYHCRRSKRHKDHAIVYVKAQDAVNERDALQMHLKRLRQAEEVLSSAVKRIQVSKTGQESYKSSLFLKIKKSFRNLHAILNKREQQLLRDVENNIADKIKDLDKQLRIISTTNTRIKALINTNIGNFSPDEVLDKFAKIERKIKGEKKKYSMIEKGVHPVEEEDVEVTYTDDLSRLCEKVEIIKLPIHGRNTQTIKVATWNLEFTDEKAKNDVLGVICTTIIHNGFDVLAVQGMGSEGNTLDKICEELNNPSLPEVQELENNKGPWRYDISEATGKHGKKLEYHGFLWNDKSGLQLSRSYLNTNPEFMSKPFVGEFLVDDWKFALFSLHMKLDSHQGEARHMHLLTRTAEVTKGADIILLGDFNSEPALPYRLSRVVKEAPAAEASAEGETIPTKADVMAYGSQMTDNCAGYDRLRDCKYLNVFNSSEYTNISATNLSGDKCCNNVWISASMEEEHCLGEVPHEVVRADLLETVSNHCPLWANFSV